MYVVSVEQCAMSNFTNKMKATADRVLFLAKKSLSETLTPEEAEELRAGAIDCAAYTNGIIEMKK